MTDTPIKVVDTQETTGEYELITLCVGDLWDGLQFVGQYYNQKCIHSASGTRVPLSECEDLAKEPMEENIPPCITPGEHFFILGALTVTMLGAFALYKIYWDNDYHDF